MVQRGKAGGNFSLRILDYFFVNLHLALIVYDFVVRLKNLFARSRIVEELSRQNLFARSGHDRPDTVRSSRSPDHFAGTVQHFKSQKGPAKGDARRQTVSRQI